MMKALTMPTFFWGDNETSVLRQVHPKWCQILLTRWETQSVKDCDGTEMARVLLETNKHCVCAILIKVVQYLYLQVVSATRRDAIYSQATVSKKVWSLVVEVMKMFESAKLKGQKLKLANLISKPAFNSYLLS